MKLNAYCIFDSAAGAYMRPFFMLSDAQARRAFTDIATDANHEVGKHPEDYHLCRVGVFDDNEGKLIPENVEVLATGIKVVAESRNVDRSQLDLLNRKIEGGQQ